MILRTRELRTTEQVMAEYQFPSREAVRKFYARHQVPVITRGRTLLVDLRDLDAVLARIGRGKRHVRRVA